MRPELRAAVQVFGLTVKPVYRELGDPLADPRVDVDGGQIDDFEGDGPPEAWVYEPGGDVHHQPFAGPGGLALYLPNQRCGDMDRLLSGSENEFPRADADGRPGLVVFEGLGGVSDSSHHSIAEVHLD